MADIKVAGDRPSLGVRHWPASDDSIFRLARSPKSSRSGLRLLRLVLLQAGKIRRLPPDCGHLSDIFDRPAVDPSQDIQRAPRPLDRRGSWSLVRTLRHHEGE